MLVRVTCAGVVIGTARFDPPFGLAYARLWPTPAYAIAAPMAEELGEEVARKRLWSREDGDFAAALAAYWKGGGLALQDMSGRELVAGSVVVVESVFGPRRLVVVADFRTDAGSRVEPATPTDRARTRPAA